jgi:DNA-binding HxlR family transcriptional regulator
MTNKKRDKPTLLGPKEAVETFHEIVDLINSDACSRAIFEALLKSPLQDGLRYNELQRATDDILYPAIKYVKVKRPSVSWKKFNEKLAGLVKLGVVKRHRKTRFNVTYKLTLTEPVNEDWMALSFGLRNIEDMFRKHAEALKKTVEKDKNKNAEDLVRGTISITLIETELYLLSVLVDGTMAFSKGNYHGFSVSLASSYRKVVVWLLLMIYELSRFPDVERILPNVVPDFLQHIAKTKKSLFQP